MGLTFNELRVAGTVFDNTKETTLDIYSKAKMKIDEFRDMLQAEGQNIGIPESILPDKSNEYVLLAVNVTDSGDLVVAFPKYVGIGADWYYGIRVWDAANTYFITITPYGEERLYKIKRVESYGGTEFYAVVREIEYVGNPADYMVTGILKGGKKFGIRLGALVLIGIGEIVKWLIVGAVLVVTYKALQEIDKWLDVEKASVELDKYRLALLENVLDEARKAYESGEISFNEYHDIVVGVASDTASVEVSREKGGSIVDRVMRYIEKIAKPLVGVILEVAMLAILVDIVKGLFRRR